MLSAIRFKLTVHDVTDTNLTKLDSLCNKYCKKWLYMTQSATTAFMHMRVGLNIKSIKQLYKECHALSHTTSRIKADSNVNATLDNK